MSTITAAAREAAWRAAFAVYVLAVLAIVTGFVHVRGWDWDIGTDTHYCYVYLPAFSAGCETAN